MRDVLGHFATGVVVVTARQTDGTLLGFTCQSFASLSLDPPLISFAPARSSSTWPRIREVKNFCVNVLAADHRDLSAGFARSGAAIDKFSGVDVPIAVADHLGGELGRGVAERPAVRDHDDADTRAGCAHPRPAAAVLTNSAVDVAPGSRCPALRSPR